MDRDKLIENAKKHYVRAFTAFSNEIHLHNVNECERLWTEWCSLEDVEIIGDLSFPTPEMRKPITLYLAEYGFEICVNCGKDAYAYYDDMLLKCPHCKREYEVEMDEDGWLSYTFLGEYSGGYIQYEGIYPAITVFY